MWPEFVESIGTRFSHEQYLYWTRIEGTLWTLADLLIAWTMIRTGNLVRGYVGARPHRISYLILLATLPGAAYIPVVDSGRLFFQLELAVTIPHFLIILYVCAFDARIGLRAINTALAQREKTTLAEAADEAT